MVDEDFKELFIKCAKDLLTVDVQEKRGMYGEHYAEISLSVDGEIINTAYLDFPQN